ncbi:MAG: DegT/DnrJ/EryC1/StrS family aminotransferase [Nitrospiraceae bacterium]|nr:DegT/DnrJ/EryC1/StrS family aminotransferase [Nitrospiraceae bacterium]
MKIPLSNPDITDLERGYVAKVLESPHLSLGPMLSEFERAFASYMGSRHAIAVNSGTSGLHLALRGLGVGEGDSVLTSPFSFIASANCILFEKAIPVFVDIDPQTYNFDVTKIEDVLARLKKNAQRPKAILPVHVFGRPCDMSPLMELAKSHSLTIIEDACEAIGAEYKGKKVGTFGDATVFAFYPNKQITTGEGGMIITDNEQLSRLCKSLRNQGRSEDGSWLAHKRLGYNYRLSEINCALGLAQLERIEEILEKRRRVAAVYAEKLNGMEELHLPGCGAGEKVSWFVYVVRLTDKYTRQDRDKILEGLRAAGIGCNNYFTPIHLQPFYRGMFGFSEGDFPVTEHIAQRTIALPFFNSLTEGQIDYITENLKRLLFKEALR